MFERLRRAKRFIQDAEEAHTSVTERSTPSIAREAAIAMLDPDRRKRWSSTGARYVVPAAVLLELVHEGRIGASGEGKKARVTVHDTAPLGDQVLDDTLLMIGSGLFGHKVTRLIAFGTSDVEVTRQLVSRGDVLEQTERALGLFTVRRHYPTPTARRDDIVARVRSSLLGESVPDDRTALLITALSLGIHSKVFVPKQAVKDADRRSAEIARGLGDDEQAVLSGVWAAIDRAS